jgi:hypothetical protein
VRADGSVERAALSPLVSDPREGSVASSHRTTRTFSLPGRSFPIATPLGTTSRFSSPI